MKILAASRLQQYQFGIPVSDIASALNKHPNSIWASLKLANPDYTELKIFSTKRKRLFIKYLKLRSLRKTSRETGIHPSALRRYFLLMHKDYSNLSRTGALVSVGDYLRKGRKVQEIEEWLIQNLESILKAEAESNTKSYSIKKINQISRRETSRFEDYRLKN